MEKINDMEAFFFFLEQHEDEERISCVLTHHTVAAIVFMETNNVINKICLIRTSPQNFSVKIHVTFGEARTTGNTIRRQLWETTVLGKRASSTLQDCF